MTQLYLSSGMIADQSDPSGATIATVFHDRYAALFIAAPAMLAALEGLTEWAKAYAPPRPICTEMEAALAAIAQAKGEA